MEYEGDWKGDETLTRPLWWAVREPLDLGGGWSVSENRPLNKIETTKQSLTGVMVGGVVLLVAFGPLWN